MKNNIDGLIASQQKSPGKTFFNGSLAIRQPKTPTNAI